MNWDLERHGWAADSEARREFIARNSTGVTKAELTGAVEKPVRYTKTPGVPSIGITDADDLTDILQKSQAAAKQGSIRPKAVRRNDRRSPFNRSRRAASLLLFFRHDCFCQRGCCS